MDKVAELIDIKLLIPWEKNPRLNEGAVKSVSASIREFGFASPIIAQRSTKRIISGHTRLRAAKLIGMKEIPVRFLDLTDSQATALNVADNKLGELAFWDEDVLVEILQELSLDDSIDLESLGFTESELKYMLSPPEKEDIPGDRDEDGIEDMGYITIKVRVAMFEHRKALEVIENALAQEDISSEVV